VVVWTVGLTLVAIGLAIFVPPVWSSAHLKDPVQTRAVSVQFRDTCARCTNVHVEYVDLHGVAHFVELHAPTNAIHYKPGMLLVYSSTDPAYAMALNSYNAGKGFDRDVGIPVTATLLAVELLAGTYGLARWLLRRQHRRYAETTAR
jgi:hypothetical protein